MPIFRLADASENTPQNSCSRQFRNRPRTAQRAGQNHSAARARARHQGTSRPADSAVAGGSGAGAEQNGPMDFKLELIVIPVADVDKVKAFYIDNAGFRLDVDHSAGDDFRVVQLTPPGSACSITLMRNPDAAGTVQGLHLIVTDIEAAKAELAGRGVDVSEVYHFDGGGQRSGPDPLRSNYNSFVSFSDPEGNGWLVQEVRQP